MMLQAGGPPDTSAFYHVAYAWVAVVYASYSAILWVRDRHVRRRLEETTPARES